MQVQVEFIEEEISLEELWREHGGTDEFSIDCQIPVLTYEGVRVADKMFKTRGPTILVYLSNNTIIEGLAEHRLMDTNHDWVLLSDISVNQLLLDENETPVQVVALEEGPEQDVYDLQVPIVHHYIANGMISHNSTLANQLAVNVAMRGFDVDIVPLEMSTDEMTARIMATVCRFDSMRIILQRLTDNEKKFIEQRFAKWRRHVERKGGSYGIFKPVDDMSIEEVYMSLNSRNSHMRIIDYLGLLSGMDGDDSWRMLGKAARTAKLNADSANCVNVLLAQVDETGKLRYSRAVQEHASNSWIFVHTRETREAGVLNIEQPKARNQKSFPFTLKVEADFMRVTDMPDNGVDEDGSDEPSKASDRPKTNLRNLADD